MDKDARQITVLVSAYACEPGFGSEPEVGWQVARHIAEHCRVKVITRANNREAIERELAGSPGNHPDFLYYDLPDWVLGLKKRFNAYGTYYVLWQLGVRWSFRKLLREVDVIHHVTYNGVQFPGAWVGTDTPVVLGPLGGGMVCPPELRRAMASEQRSETLRSGLIRNLRWLPWWKPTLGNASVVLAANRETAEVLETQAGVRASVMLETAIDPCVCSTTPVSPRAGGPLRVFWLGGMVPRKAPAIAIRAVAAARARGADVELVLGGSGPEEKRMKRLIHDLGLEDTIRMAGRIPKGEVPDWMDRSDAFLFTSLRDTSGNVVLEAMSRGLPVVALNHQGVREICTPQTALLVPPVGEASTIQGLADALVQLAQDPGLGARLGAAGRERTLGELTWAAYAKRMMSYYRMAIGGSRE